MLRYVEAQLQTRLAQMKAPAADQKGALLKEYVSGEYSGIELFSKIPEIALQSGEQQLRKLAKQVSEENLDED